MRKLFYARHFQPTAWDASEEKAEFANLFVRFVESDFSRQFFTGKFYQRMVCMFGFHAFPNCQNFWDHYFGDEAGRQRFILSCIGHRHAGDAAATYADVHARLQEWLRARFPALTTDEALMTSAAADGAEASTFDASPPGGEPRVEDANTNRETPDVQRSFAW
jgi:hypothetical protein